jgi:hypothetical protein
MNECRMQVFSSFNYLLIRLEQYFCSIYNNTIQQKINRWVSIYVNNDINKVPLKNRNIVVYKFFILIYYIEYRFFNK